MAKKNSAIYAHGELSRIREKLGVTDPEEAKRMQQLLGGQIGTERPEEKEEPRRRKAPIRRETVKVAVAGKGGGRSLRRAEAGDFGDDEDLLKTKSKVDFYPEDDPSVPAKLNYRERVKIDQYAGQIIFEIKNSFQVLASIFSFFRDPVDYVNPRFVLKRLSEYYHKIEKLVTGARHLFPKSNTRRSNQLKRASPFVFKIMDTMRSWNIEEIANNIADLQSRPRSSKVTDFSELLREVYKPLFLLSDLNTENIKSAFKLIYKILYIESPMEAKEKYQDVIRNLIGSLIEIRRDVQFGLFPLLLKLISDRFIPYERFFIERRRRYMAFLNVTAGDQLNSSELEMLSENININMLQKEGEEDEKPEEEGEGQAEEIEEDPNDPKVVERKAREEAERIEKRALEQGQFTMEALFPKAGWEKLEEFPDFYAYFANVYNMKNGCELISPTDPLQQAAVMMHILDDLFIGLRYVNFGMITFADGTPTKISEEINEIINNWRIFIEDSLFKDYLPRLSEYCRILENSRDAKNSAYAKKILNELHWVKRLYFFPYYKFESIGPPPFQKDKIEPIYNQVRKMRKYLTSIAVGIEQGIKAGGAAAKAPCDGINNPWENWNFQVPNPVSKRMEAMIPAERKINATLIFFSLSAIAVLDYILNNENSWAYKDRPGTLFRSVKDEGIFPIFGANDKVDADQIFKDSLKKKE